MSNSSNSFFEEDKSPKGLWLKFCHQETIKPDETVPQIPPEGVDVKDKEEGRSGLHWAVSEGHLPMVKYLLSIGASPDVADNLGWTPLMSASSMGRQDIVAILLEALKPKEREEGEEEGKSSFNIDQKNKSGCTALHYAASKGHASIIVMLLKEGASPREKDTRGNTPLHKLSALPGATVVTANALFDNTKVKKDFLLRIGNVYKETPLHFAVQMKNAELAAWYIQCGANVDAKDEEGKTPLEYARDDLKKKISSIKF